MTTPAVLRAAVSVGVAAGRRPAAEGERDRERDGGERVGRVVQRVSEECHRSGRDDHHALQCRGTDENRERHAENTHAPVARLERDVDGVGDVVRVGGDEVTDPRDQRPPVWMRVGMVVVVVAVAVMIVTSARVVAVLVLTTVIAVSVARTAGLAAVISPAYPSILHQLGHWAGWYHLRMRADTQTPRPPKLPPPPGDDQIATASETSNCSATRPACASSGPSSPASTP